MNKYVYFSVEVLFLIVFSGNYPIEAKNILYQKVNLVTGKTTMSEIIDILTARYIIPISFIQAEDDSIDIDNGIAVSCNDGNLKCFLDKIVSKSKNYKYGIIENHLVVYPNDSLYDSEIDFVMNEEKKRLNVLSEYISFLKEKIPEFNDVFLPVGDIRGSIYSDTVKIATKGSIVEGFMKLLGDKYDDIVISIRIEHGLDYKRIKPIRLLSVIPSTSYTHQMLIKMELENVSMKDVVDYLRKEYRLPVSFIQDGKLEETRFNINKDGRQYKIVDGPDGAYYMGLPNDFTTVLLEVAAASGYSVSLDNNHYIVFPPLLDQQINAPSTLMDLKTAADVLFREISDRYKLFKSFSVKFDGLVSDNEKITFEYENEFNEKRDEKFIMGCLKQLLGSNYYNIFTIIPQDNYFWEITFDSLNDK